MTRISLQANPRHLCFLTEFVALLLLTMFP